MKINKILVPVDFSAPSREAVDWAVPFSKHFGAELHLLHVFEPGQPFVDLTAGVPVLLPDPEAQTRASRQLRELADAHAVAVERDNLHSIKGRAFEEICRLAARAAFDLIIIPTRGNTGMKHLLLGSTAERVVRYSPCPVLVVRPGKTGGKSGAPPAFNKIVVPIDFSDCSMQALAYARNFAREFGSTLLLLHSVHLQYYVASDEYARYDFPEVMKEAEDAAREQLAELVAKTDWQGTKIETALESGHPGQQICERAEHRAADLIITSTHGRTGFKHVLVGSTAEYVVRHAGCPVLVVPTRERIAFD